MNRGLTQHAQYKCHTSWDCEAGGRRVKVWRPSAICTRYSANWGGVGEDEAWCDLLTGAVLTCPCWYRCYHTNQQQDLRPRNSPGVHTKLVYLLWPYHSLPRCVLQPLSLEGPRSWLGCKRVVILHRKPEGCGESDRMQDGCAHQMRDDEMRWRVRYEEASLLKTTRLYRL